MEVYASRLASFNTSHAAKKKRASESKAGRTLKWPHKNPAPAKLAEAGFFFAPTSSAPDNTTCFVCDANIDGWEAQDDPVEEHIKFSPQCGWAVNRAIEQSEQAEELKAQDPMSETMVEARRMTFRGSWPHEGKRGWVCKTQRMIDAGWYYCPTSESEDYVKCAYCCLGLDGWEPKDNPYTEHQRRSPDCSFFAPAVAAPKAKGGKTGRLSKASSRVSTQSDQTMLSEASSANWEVFGNDSVITIESEIAPPSGSSMATKRGGRPKRASRLLKNTDVAPQSSFVEPENDDFEVKVAPPVAKRTRGRKRKSDEIEDDIGVTGAEPGSTGIVEPPTKRRTTRSRNSVLHAATPPVATTIIENSETQMGHADTISPPPLPKTKKGGRKRASSRTRQVSTASTASVASLRVAVPDDSEIDAALEADLNLPLSEDEAVAIAEEGLMSRKRRLTKTKPASQTEVASAAPVRDTARNSKAEQNLARGDSMQDIQHEAPIEKSKMRVVSRQKASVSQSEPLEPAATNVENDPKDSAPKKRGPKGKKASRKELARRKQDQEPSQVEVEEEQQPVLESSVVELHRVPDNLEYETDAGMAQSQSEPAAEKRGGASKKTKDSQKLDERTTSNAEDKYGVAASVQPEQAVDEHTVEEANAQIEEPQLVSKKSSKTTHKTKKGAKGKAKPVKAVTPPPTLPSSSPLQVIEASRHEDAEIQRSLPSPAAVEATPTKPVAAQSMTSTPSDIENKPPSSRPASVRPPLQTISPSKFQPIRVPLALSTPIASPSKNNISKLQTSLPWTAVDLETFFLGSTSPEKENAIKLPMKAQGELSSPEKKMTVEEWIKKNAGEMEERLRGDCERLVGKFEEEGMRALRTLEGVVCMN